MWRCWQSIHDLFGLSNSQEHVDTQGSPIVSAALSDFVKKDLNLLVNPAMKASMVGSLG